MKRQMTFGAVAAVWLLTGCSPADQTDPRPSNAPAAKGASGTGTVAVRLEQIEGVLVEGFELRVRIESPPGTEVFSAKWGDLVRGQNADGIQDYYDYVLRRIIPSGQFTIRTTMHPGVEDAQPVCVTQGNVNAGAVRTLTVKFHAQNGCATLA